MSRAFMVLITFLLVACQAATPTTAPTHVAPPTATVEAKPAVTPTPLPPLISELVVNDTTTAANWTVLSNIQLNDQQFGDRAYVVAKLPAAYAGLDWIRTAADSKKFIGAALATFKVSGEAEVLVAHDDRLVTKPAWLKDWVDTGDDILTSEATPTILSIFKKSFAANSVVTLGENGGSSGALQYMVLVRRPGQVGKISTQTATTRTCQWDACLAMPTDWYGSSEAIRIADNVLLFQRNTGGWYKNIDMAAVIAETIKPSIANQKTYTDDSTIDNGATTTQMIYLARVYNATKTDRFKDGFLKGVDYLLAAQYENGGWPQYYPVDPAVYYARITYNDNAMINVMTLLRDITNDPVYGFVDKDRQAKANKAVQKGIEVILKTQIIVNGKKTAWCAQHNEKTLAPAPARAYELESISGQESVGLVRFLMSIDKPSPEVIDAVQAAVKWFNDSKIAGIQVSDRPDAALPGGFDRVVTENPNAPPIWARFYDLNTNKPFFVGRDSVKKNTLAEIEHERRVGYAYYTNAPAYLLANDYPAWQKKWVTK